MNQSLPDKLILNIGPSGGKTQSPPVVQKMVLEIVRGDDPVLHTPCNPAPVGPHLITENKSLVECMLQVCRANKGYGLTANQLGLSRAVFVMDVPTNGEFDQAYFNPKILQFAEEIETMEEGCLSLPYILHRIKRPKWVILSWQDIYGDKQEKKFHGVTARVIFHEMDHIAGKTLLDHMSPMEIRRARERQSKMFKKTARRSK